MIAWTERKTERERERKRVVLFSLQFQHKIASSRRGRSVGHVHDNYCHTICCPPHAATHPHRSDCSRQGVKSPIYPMIMLWYAGMM